jgi:hypothetical protein
MLVITPIPIGDASSSGTSTTSPLSTALIVHIIHPPIICGVHPPITRGRCLSLISCNAGAGKAHKFGCEIRCRDLRLSAEEQRRLAGAKKDKSKKAKKLIKKVKR